MPGGDKTGPRGEGPMSGRQAGYCAGYDAPGYANPWPRWGRGAGFGWRGRGGWGGGGRGWRHRFYATGRPGWAAYGPYWGPPAPPPMTREQEIDSLRAYAEGLQEELQQVKERLEGLEEK